MKDRVIKQLERFSQRPQFRKNIILFLTIFLLLFFVLSDATGLNITLSDNQTYNSGNATNISESEIGIDLLNNNIESQISESQTFTFGSLTVLDSIFNPIFCLITLYDTDGIVKISDTDSLIIDTINPGSHLYIESQEKNIKVDFSINGDSFDPVIILDKYGTSNPIGDYNPPGLPLEFVSIASDNLSYSNIQLTFNYLDDVTIDASDLRIFKYVETFAYNEWVELPTSVDEINKAVSAETDSGTIFAVSVLDITGYSKNITIGDLSVLNSIGVVQQAGIEIIGTDGVIAAATGVLSINEVPQGSHLIINSPENNVTLDFTLNNDSLNPVILLEDFGVDNPAGDYLPPGKPVKYFMINAENLGYSNVDLTIHYPNVSKNIGLFRLDETSAYNEWGEITTAIDKINNTISASLNSLSIFALSKKPRKDLNVVDVENKPLTVDINTYDSNKIVQKSKRGNKLLPDEMPDAGYIKINALAEKDVAVTFNAADTFGGDIVLDNYGKHNPKYINPNRAFVKFVEIHTKNDRYDSAEIEIKYSDDEIVSFEESKLQIAHYVGGEWVILKSIVEEENNIVRASTDSFSTFALIYNGTSVNTKKSIYQPGETAEIVIVVLDSAGAPVSDASIQMNVTAPNGSTEYFSTSISSIMETSDPGVYEAVYVTGMEGQYNISCTAIIEGNESRFDTYFMVLTIYDFDIIRYAQSKIDPTKYDTFDVRIDIISYTDADTITVWEYTPANFEVYTDANVVEGDNLNVLTWQRSLVNNQASVNYSYSVPMEWPKLYQLGPLEIDYGNKTFTEARPWYVAADPESVHTYDFSSGVGLNRSAYRYQVVSPKPPNNNTVPNIQFTSDEYNNTKTNDNNFQSDYADSLNNYATHRFKFDIEENVETITKIFIFWNGIGYNDWSNFQDGSTLYIWNNQESYYESLEFNNSDNEIDLSVQITTNFENYLDADGNVTVLVQQNGYTTQSTGGMWRHSHLETDYIKVNITYTLIGNHPPSVETLKTYNSSLIERNIFEIGENVTIRVNVTDPEGADNIDKVLIKLTHPNSTVMVNNNTMTNISTITKGYIYEYNYTIPDELASKGYWIVHVYANDTSDAKADTLTLFKVISLDVTVNAGGPYNPGDTVYIDGRVLYFNGTPVDQAAVELNSTDPDNIAVNYTTVYTNTSGYYTLNYTLNGNATIGIYTVKANITKDNLQQIENATYSVEEVLVPSNIRIVTDRDVYLITPQIWVDEGITYYSPRVVNITVLIMDDDGLPLQGKNLSVNITYPNNSVRSVTIHESGGYWNGSFTVYHDDPKGTYSINANVTNGVSYSENSTFDVNRFKCDSGGCHDYEFHKPPPIRGAHNASAQETHMAHSPVSARGGPTSGCTLCHTGQNLDCDECHTDLFRGTHANDTGDPLTERCNNCHIGYNDSTDTGIDKPVPECNTSDCHGGEHEDKPAYLHNNTHAGNKVDCGYCHNNMHSIFEPTCTLCHQTYKKHRNTADAGQIWGDYWITNSTNGACLFCHDNASSIHSSNALGPPYYFKNGNVVNQSISTTGTWCGACHYKSNSEYGNATSYYSPDPPEITNGTEWLGRSSGYFNHTLSNYNDSICKACHGANVTGDFMTEFIHDVSEGGGSDCVNCHDIGKTANNQINVSAMNATGAVHKYLNNDTSASNSSDYYANNKRCWACHGDGTEPSGHPGNFNIPYVCGDCHNRSYNLPYTNSTRIASLTKKPVTEHLQSPYYEQINSTIANLNATCLGCHNNSLVIFNDTGFNLSANVSHYTSRTDLVTPTTNCNLCHKDETNATLYWANTVRHPAKSSEDTFCDNCHNTTPANDFHNQSLVKPGDIHSYFDYQNDDDNEIPPTGTAEACYACHGGFSGAVKVCEDCHLTSGSGPRNDTGDLRTDFNETVPLVYTHTNVSLVINVKNQSSLFGNQTKSSCFGFNADTLEGSCHAVSYRNRSNASGFYAFYDVNSPDSDKSPYHWTYTIDRMPNTTQCQFCHNQSNSAVRVSWGNATQITYQSGGIHQWYTDNDNSQCWSCHENSGSMPVDFHSANLTSGGGPDCVSCHDMGKVANNQINVSAMNASAAVHKYLNNDTSASNASEYYANNKRCWACHGDGTEPSTGGHPSNFITPYVCGDCHNRTYNLEDTNASRITNLTTRPLAEHLQSPFYENINSTVQNLNATCIGCHNNSMVSFNDTGFNLSANVSHYTSRTDLVTPTTNCNLCHKDETNATLYWANTVRHPAKSSEGTFCDNCHNTTPANDFHNQSLVKPGDIHSYFDYQNDDDNEIPPTGTAEACYACHGGFSGAVKVCEDCHLTSGSGPRNDTGDLRTDFNETVPLVYTHTNVSLVINVKNQSSLFGNQTKSSCFGFNADTLEGSCHAVSYRNRSNASGFYAFYDVNSPDSDKSPYHWTYTIDRMPNTTQCQFCHNQSNSAVRVSWGNATQITYQPGGIHQWYTDNDNSQCWSCHENSGSMPVDFHSANLTSGGGADCVSCHDLNKIALKKVDVSNMNQSGNMHKNLNNGTGTSLNSDNERCWACHGDGTEPADGHPSNFYTPYECLDCHNNSNLTLIYTNDSRKNNLTTRPVFEHNTNASEIITTVNCSVCHKNSIALYNDPDGGSMAANVSHYGTNTNLNDTVGYTTDGCIYCHLNYINSLTWGNATDLTNVTFPRNHSETTNNQCWICHIDDNVTINSFHNEQVNPGWDPECIGCHFLFDYMQNKNTSIPGYMNSSTAINKYVNGTMFNDGVHSLETGLKCRNCHTKYNRSEHPPPEYSWRWCEDCHVVQNDPINDTDRHNVTIDPWNYTIGGTSVVNITDCTVCHNSTLYDTSKATFNRSSGKDCRYCHTFPDQSYN